MKPTQQEIIELAREAGVLSCGHKTYTKACADAERLVHLALERFGAGGGEPVATIGANFQLLWSRVDWSDGLNVGDMLYTHPSPTDLRAEYLRGLEDAKKVALDADHMGSVNLKLMKNRIGNAIEALKGKQ